MLKSTRLVIMLGTLLGASVAVLPARSFAATSIANSTNTVSATINGYLAFTEVDHVAGTGYETITENGVDKGYTGTFSLMDSTENFGTTTFEVTCNYNSTKTPYVDADGDATTTETILAGTSDGEDGTYFGDYVSSNCANGWTVKADSTYDDGTYATMNPVDTSTNSFKIKSTDSSTNPLSGTSANWLLKTAAVSGSNNSSVAAATGYSSFGIVPKDAAAVVTGNTFTGTNNATYLGPQQFTVTYGFTAGMDAVADTYTGEIVYTLHINAAS